MLTNRTNEKGKMKMENFTHLINLGLNDSAALSELHFICKHFNVELDVQAEDDFFSCSVSDPSKLKKVNFDPCLFDHNALNLVEEKKETPAPVAPVAPAKQKTPKQLACIAKKERVKVVNGRGCKIEYKVFSYEAGEPGDLIKTYFSYEEIPSHYWTAEYMIVHDYYGKLNDEYYDTFYFAIADHI